MVVTVCALRWFSRPLGFFRMRTACYCSLDSIRTDSWVFAFTKHICAKTILQHWTTRIMIRQLLNRFALLLKRKMNDLRMVLSKIMLAAIFFRCLFFPLFFGHISSKPEWVYVIFVNVNICVADEFVLWATQKQIEGMGGRRMFVRASRSLDATKINCQAHDVS